MRKIVSQKGRTALASGQQKINLHQMGVAIEPKSAIPTPGSADLCFITNQDSSRIVAHLEARGAQIIDGPVERVGAAGSMMSVYVRDPDGNLIEISHDDANART
jgi:catechol 2,3-dioxygenase-like lactoylglutathione lyase family enzyme